jgi:hypothetical protein
MRRTTDGKTAVAVRRERKRTERERTLEGSLHLLRKGAMSFTEFQACTFEQWWRIARHLHRKWRPPTGVDVADVCQELLIAAWQFVGTWDSSRGVTLERYVVWNAADKAKKALHKQRGAKLSGSADRNPTRAEALTDDGEVYARVEVSIDVDDKVLTQRYERAKEIAREVPIVDGLVIVRLARTWSVKATALELYANPQTRLALHLGNEAASVRLVRGVLRRAACRYAQPHRNTCCGGTKTA